MPGHIGTGLYLYRKADFGERRNSVGIGSVGMPGGEHRAVQERTHWTEAGSQSGVSGRTDRRDSGEATIPPASGWTVTFPGVQAGGSGGGEANELGISAQWTAQPQQWRQSRRPESRTEFVLKQRETQSL
jgi:hypothetical protein